MDAIALTVRSRRLDRLRQSRPAEHSPADARIGDRAHRLAATLSGRVERYRDRSVVVTEVSGILPVDRDRLARLPDPIDAGRPLVCLDTETTGLGTAAGTMCFLVGIGTWVGHRFSVRQLFLPDHADEPALLAAIAAAIPPDACLVTYNGRSFDWPLLVARFRLHEQAPPMHASHMDLLTLARQIWRHRLPDARLASVERGIAGVVRLDDLPGALIPARYFEFLRSGHPEPLLDVLRHNRQDVASLARLMACLGDGLDPVAFGRSMHPGDLGGLGRVYVRRRRYVEAMACFDQALRRVPDERVQADRARLLARLGRFEEADREWQAVAARAGPRAAIAWIQVAKHLEHRRRDAAGALKAAEHASTLMERARSIGRPTGWLERDIQHRLARLRRATMRSPPLLRTALRLR